jgi:hypothetical protein
MVIWSCERSPGTRAEHGYGTTTAELRVVPNPPYTSDCLHRDDEEARRDPPPDPRLPLHLSGARDSGEGGTPAEGRSIGAA